MGNCHTAKIPYFAVPVLHIPLASREAIAVSAQGGVVLLRLKVLHTAKSDCITY